MRHSIISILIALFVTLYYQIVWGQQTLPFVENFNYPIGNLVTESGGVWSNAASTDEVPVQVIGGNLIYPGYSSSGVGNEIKISGGTSGETIKVVFTQQDAPGDAVYLSFLLKLTDDSNISAGGTNFAYLTQNSSITQKSRLNIKTGSSSNKFQLGFVKTGSIKWLSSDLDVGTTYLIVISYEFLSGTNNDVARLWLNPDLSGNMPDPDIEFTTGGDAFDIGGFALLQNSQTPNAIIDAVRITPNWDYSALPVELSYFTAFTKGNSITLKWQTSTEVNNFGFDVERRTLNEGWKKIGFVAGSGNSNSPKSYSFTDKPDNGNTFSYRLRQLDNNGIYKYYESLDVSLLPSPTASLMQNSPNPFNPSTAIKFYIPADSKVKISIYDMLGREVTTLLDEQRQAGYHTVYWNGKDKYGGFASSGVYIYRLIAGNYTETKKMNLLK